MFLSFALLIKCEIQFNDIKDFFSNIGQLTAQQYRENLIKFDKNGMEKISGGSRSTAFYEFIGK